MPAFAKFLMGASLVAALVACSVGGSLPLTPTSLPPGSPASPVKLSIADSGRTVTVPVGSEIDITLQSIGPGQYANPQVSSPAVRLVSTSILTPYLPAGPTQLFRFEAVAPGKATISIQGGNNPTFSITLEPR